jgi:hypothetical protein
MRDGVPGQINAHGADRQVLWQYTKRGTKVRAISNLQTISEAKAGEGGGGGGNRTRVRKPSANRAYMLIRFVEFRGRAVRTGKGVAPLVPKGFGWDSRARVLA